MLRFRAFRVWGFEFTVQEGLKNSSSDLGHDRFSPRRPLRPLS